MYKRVLAIIVTGTLFWTIACRNEGKDYTRKHGNDYPTGSITLCDSIYEIRFYATVVKDQGWAQHLIYLHGYQWLKNHSAMIAEVSLSDIQHSIALLHWELWDNLWLDKENDLTRDIKVNIRYGSNKSDARHFINSADELFAGDLMFFGSPYFDPVALGSGGQVDCSACPVFPLEQAALNRKFIRKSGATGYYIDPGTIPEPGTRVEVIMRLPVP